MFRSPLAFTALVHRRPWASAGALCVAAALVACGGDDDVAPTAQTGRFGPMAVSGLDVSGGTTAAHRTDAQGQYRFTAGETLKLAIGALSLGSAPAGATLGPLQATEGAAAVSDRRVTNKVVLLLSVDADGDLNNGIQITDKVRDAVSQAAAALSFDQVPAAFRTALAPVLAAAEAAGAFTDLDPRPRTARAVTAAVDTFQRAGRTRHTVATTAGDVAGYEANAGTWQFLGIPYAQPPVGDLRWRAPVAPAAWTRARDAIAWADQAAQTPALERFGEGGMSEDCLYLNVTAPKTAAKAPVMVWFHGGGFTSLTSNTKPFNNAAAMASRGVVQVSVNHRLGALGYIGHPLLSAESGHGSGNYGQMDLVMALQWVRDNIARFGGDPDNVTIFGESGGGRKVLSLMASPQARGLFHKAISQSGTLIPDSRSLASAEAIGSELGTRLNATTLAELRAKPWTDVVAAAATLVPYTNVDGFYLPETERVRFESHQQNDVPFLIVVNTNDTVDPIETVKNVFPWMSTHSTAPHYAALFSHVPAGWRARGVTAWHSAELTYVFNAQDSVVTQYLLGLVLDPATNAKLVIGDLNGNGVTGTAGDTADIFASAGFDATDTAVAQQALDIWTTFARTGNPSVPGLIDWPAYTPANDRYVELAATPVAKTGLSAVFP